MPKIDDTKIDLLVDRSTGKLTVLGDDDLRDPDVPGECAHAKGWLNRRVEWDKGPHIVTWKVVFETSPFDDGETEFGTANHKKGGTIASDIDALDPVYKYTIEYTYKDLSNVTRPGSCDPKIVIQDPGDGIMALLRALLGDIRALCADPEHPPREAVNSLCALVPDIERFLPH